MTEWRDEIETTMDAIVDNVPAIQTVFVAQEALVLLVDILKDCTETVRIVDGITEAGRINNGESQFDTAFFNLHCGCVQCDGLLLFGCEINDK